MGGRENIKQNKSTESNKVFDTMEEFYSIESYIEKKGELKEYKENSSKVWREMLQIKELRVGWWKEPCIGLTQENSVQDCLPYIQIPNGPCKLFLAYPKWPCVRLKVNMCFIHCMTSSFQNLLYPSMCYVTLWPCYLMWPAMW